ncbi:MAG: AEC family transporter [Anaerovoracaceae bacterium]
MALVFSKVLSIFLIIGVGFLANKKGILPDSSNQFLVDLLMRITSPCMVLTSIAGKELTDDTLVMTLQTFFGAALYFLLFSLLGYTLFGKVLKFQPKEDVPVYTMIFVSMNCGFMGLPLTFSLFGDDILYLMVIINMVHTFYLFPFGQIQLQACFRSSESKRSIRNMISAAANPCTLSAVAGLVLLLTGIHLPEFLFSSLEMIGDATVPISMLLVGVQLGKSNFRHLFQNRKLLLVAGLRMAAVPIIMFLILNPMPLSVDLKTALVFSTCFASGASIVPVIAMEKGNTLLASEGVALTTLFSLLVIPLSSTFLLSFYGLA